MSGTASAIKGLPQMNRMLRRVCLGLASAALLLPAALAAQDRPQSEEFLEAIRTQDGATVTRLAVHSSPAIINARGFDGDTPLTIAVRNRSSNFVGFLLQHDADPDLADAKGNTPLTIATSLGWAEGIRLLLGHDAAVNSANRSGETALVLAVQARQPRLVKMLLEAGANPDLADRAAGLSARDYARRETRVPEMLRLIEASRKR
jgi:ankyrin repeat protein